jgi:hypothetical protein
VSIARVSAFSSSGRSFLRPLSISVNRPITSAPREVGVAR